MKTDCSILPFSKITETSSNFLQFNYSTNYFNFEVFTETLFENSFTGYKFDTQVYTIWVKFT